MAKIKVTPNNIKAKIADWKNGLNTLDEYVFLPSEGIDSNAVTIDAWDKEVLIKVEAESGPFMKFIFIEKILK